MLDRQILRYREALGASSDDDNWFLCGNFGTAVLTGAYNARLIGADDFSDEVGHVRIVMFMWACLKTHLVMQAYTDLEFIAHPEIGDLVANHLIRARTHMYMYTALKSENADLKDQMEMLSSNMDKLESLLGCQENDIKKLKEKK
jgi:hypothetical protein